MGEIDREGVLFRLGFHSMNEKTSGGVSSGLYLSRARPIEAEAASSRYSSNATS
jgi:hypothetical protein